MKKLQQHNHGSVIVSILVMTLFLTTVIFALIVQASASTSRARSRVLLLQAQYAAESGADGALAVINSGNTSYTGTTSDVQVMANGTIYKATYSVTVTAGSSDKEKVLTSTGKVYAPASSVSPQFTRKIEVIAQRTSTSTTSSIVSRNILNTTSGVKNVEAVDLYVNGYISMNKNTTNLIAENITVVDRNTGASNCSIGGTGNLLKPATFTHAGQTKTNITMGYNNCISPPGNVSNASFTVLPNQTTLTKIQSTYVPWSQYMDNSYTDSPSGCNDWTTGSWPRNIPATINSKKTHYPDSNSGISTSCGNSGDLTLTDDGTYNIRDNVHIRANICAASGCSVKFNNPDATIKYIFIEGTFRFNSINTSANSGPIVIIAYGSDPISLAGSCPLGGAGYLGDAGSTTTSAPAVYLIATSGGICLDKTKFGVDKALGGVSGKNIDIGTNPGTPFDLAIDPNFPISQIPIDLFWRAMRYRRL